jgi:predicted MFS family arabinose efflux permease
MASHDALVPAVYPARLRASARGLAVGIGRIGATVGPLLGGIVLARGATTAVATIAMTLPLLGCAVLLRRVGRRTALS